VKPRTPARARAAACGVLAAELLLLGMTGGCADAGPGPVRAELTCQTGYGGTSGWIRCKGSGTWRGVADCLREPDRRGRWISQLEGPHRQSFRCVFRIAAVYREVR